jgi:hypothetical protein
MKNNYNILIIFPAVNQTFRTAARKVLINDDTVNRFSFMLPGKGNSEIEEIKGMYHVYSSSSC